MELMTSMAVWGLLMAGLLQFFLFSSKSLMKGQSELWSVEEKRYAAQRMHADAENSDYLLVYDSVDSISNGDANQGADGSGNVAFFVSQSIDSATDEIVVSASAYYLNQSSIERIVVDLRFDDTDQQSFGTAHDLELRVAQTVAASIKSERDIKEGIAAGSPSSRVILENATAIQGKDFFYLPSAKSVVLSASVTEGQKQTQFSKELNIISKISSS